MAQVKITVDQPAPAPSDKGRPDKGGPGGDGKLSLENAVPLPVPPAPRISTPKPVTAPRPFVAPVPVVPPPVPEVAEMAPVNPPDAPRGAPAPAPVQPRETPMPPPPAAVAALPPAAVAALPPESKAPPVPLPPKPEFLSVMFDGADDRVPASAETLLAQVAERMRANEAIRLQLRSYASGTADMAREARQRSLNRALAVRERLTALGVRSLRIDIRALGNTAPEGPDDRIDVEFLNE